MAPLSQVRSFWFIATICLLEILAGAEIDLFTPSFPEMQAVFNLEPYMVELTLSLNLIAQCVFSLVLGDLGDRWGRKNLIVAGLIFFVMGSFLCVEASSFTMLLWGRVLQGVGISGPGVLAYVVVADLYSAKKQMQIMGVMNGLITLAMAAAPILGSYISLWFHWRGNFIVLLVLGVLALIASALFIPAESMERTAVGNMLSEYRRVLRSRSFWLFMGTLLPCALSFWVFISFSPILYMEGFNVPLDAFGFYQGALCLVFAMGSFLGSWTLRKFGMKATHYGGLRVGILFCILNLVVLVMKLDSPVVVTSIMIIESIAAIYPFLILWPFFLETVPDAKGKITALFTAIRMIMTALAIEGVAYLYNGTYLSLGIFILLSCALMVGFGWNLGKKERLET